MALLLAGLNEVASEADKNIENKYIKVFYEHEVRSCLSSYRWAFATRREVLAEIVYTPAIDDGYRRYNIPVDLISIIAVYPYYVDYVVDKGVIKTRAEALDIEYVSRVDEIIFPAYFKDYVVNRLALVFARAGAPMSETLNGLQRLFIPESFSYAVQCDHDFKNSCANNTYPNIASESRVL